jgi:RNA polymerase sigma factor (sigma-70 family)
LYQIARNVARTHLGKERRRPQTQDLYQDETLEQKVADTSREAAPEATMIARDEDRAVRAALAEIPEKMRAALVHRFFRHLEYQEIADTMHETLGNTKTLIHRGKAALAKVFLRERTSVTTTVGVTTSREDRREVLCL